MLKPILALSAALLLIPIHSSIACPNHKCASKACAHSAQKKCQCDKKNVCAGCQEKVAQKN